MWDIYIQKYTVKEIIMKKFGYKTETLMEDIIMSYEKLGFVSGQKLKAEHLNHMEEGIANAGGVSSWNDLADKPFYSEMVEGTAEFDGDLTGKECVDYGNGISMVKITENTVTLEQLVGSTVVVKAPDGYDDVVFEITEDMIEVQTVTETTGMMIVVADELPLMFVAYGDVAAAGAPFSDGTYFMYQPIDGSDAYTRSLSCLSGMQEKVHKIDAKYLPAVGLKAEEVDEAIVNKVPTMIDDAIAAQVPALIDDAIAGAIGGSY
jgi:hypothetical protein